MGSDDHIQFPSTPDEFKEMVKKQHDRMHMEQEAYSHGVANLFDSLSQDQASTLRSLMGAIGNSTDGAGLPAYYEGILVGLLHTKYNICLGCGEDHDEVFAEKEAQAAKDAALPVEDGTPDEADLMVIYGIMPAAEGKVACKNCGWIYPSLQDRMLRDPGEENCPGCVQKAKWG